MKPYLKTTICLFFACIAMTGAAQEACQHIDDMPCEETTSIVQDSEGYMWFGTRLGLVRYDGYQLQVHRNDIQHPHAFSSCDIRSLYADAHGHVFAGSFFGLNTFDIETRRITAQHFKGNDYISALCVSPADVLWAGTGNGLYRMGKEGVWQRQKGISGTGIVQLSAQTDHSLLVLTDNSGIYRISQSGNRCQHIEGTERMAVTSVAAKADGSAFVGTRRNGLYLYMNGRLLPIRGFNAYSISSLHHSERQRSLLVGTDKGLLTLHDTGGVSTLLADKSINNLFEDRSGNLWISTVGNGIWLYHSRQTFRTSYPSFAQRTSALMSQFAVVHLPDTSMLSHHANINCLYEDSQGRTYLGTLFDGLYIYRNRKLERHLTSANTSWLRHNDCYALTKLQDGQTLLATWDGLYQFDPNSGQGHAIDQIGRTDIKHMHILTINRTSRNELWFGLVGGIARVELNGNSLQKARLTLYTHVGKRGIPQPEKVSSLTDKHTTTGAYQLGGIYRIVNDKAGRTWACTSEPGLLRYDKTADAFRSVSQQYGIKGDNVHSMNIDRRGDYWLTTNYGIMLLRLNAQGGIQYQHLYTRKDGLPTNYFGNAMSTLLADGTICIVNQRQLVTVTPATTDSPRRPQQVAIADIVVCGKRFSDLVAEGKASYAHGENIRLSHRQNSVSVSFTTFDYGEESSVRYVYKLDGVDAQHMLTDLGQNSAGYNQLQPGKYTLYYGIYMSEGESAGGLQSVTIEIMQPLWWRWWAKAAYAIIILGVICGIAHNRARHVRAKHQLEIMAIEKRNLDERYNKMMQFYTRVIHEFMSPIALMSGVAHELQQKVRPALQASACMLASQTDKLLDAMNHIAKANDDRSVREALQQAKEMTLADQDFLRRCTESVNRHIDDENYNHQVMMNEVGASHATLYRKLKALTGMDSTSFIRTIRMKTACQILNEEPNIRIGELALRVGYANPKYFATCFKKQFGMSPREYGHPQL